MPTNANIALETIRSLADGLRLEHHNAGEVIFSKGDPGDVLYAIVEGTVAIEWGEGRHELLEPGDCFGFDVMIDPIRHRYCTATASSPVKLLPMNREHFLVAIHEFPMFALESLQLMDERLRRVKAMARADL